MEILKLLDECSVVERYHWQDTHANLIIRWDNAPHHPDLATFPHHSARPTNIFVGEMYCGEICRGRACPCPNFGRPQGSPLRMNEYLACFCNRHVGAAIEPSRELNAAAILETIAAHISPNSEE